MGLGNNIKFLRVKRKYTQKELAKKINVSSQVISNWEREYTTPTADDVKLLADALDTSPENILGSKSYEEYDFLKAVNDPELKRWIIEDLSLSDDEDLKKLRAMWDIIKSDKND